MKDLEPVNWESMGDIYARFEAQLPFNRILVKDMIEKIDEAEKECGSAGFVTLQALRKALPSAAWEPLNDPKSKLTEVLLSAFFKNEEKGQAADQVDSEYLKMFALLHCRAPKKGKDKAEILYGLLQEGGFEAHEQISAGDKDLVPVFKKLCSFVTHDIFEMAKASGDSVEIYTAVEVASLISDGTLEIVREDQWLEGVYGVQARLENSAWVERVVKEGKWIYSATELRAKLFA